MFQKITSIFLALSLLLAVYFFVTKSKKNKLTPLTIANETVSFNFTNQEGKSIDKSFLKGKVWLASFILTGCKGPCPLITRKMAAINEEFKTFKNLGLLSFSVDPINDSPLKLFNYIKENKLNLYNKWHFLSGNYELTKKLIRKTFFLPFTDNPQLHTTKLILFTSDFKVYGYYDSLEAKETKKLQTDIKKLLRQNALS